MLHKLNRSFWGALAVFSLIVPPAQALNDDVAVQLLERLNELEEEVQNLRGQNENLRDKLQSTPTRSEELRALDSEIINDPAVLDLDNPLSGSADKTDTGVAESAEPLKELEFDDFLKNDETNPVTATETTTTETIGIGEEPKVEAISTTTTPAATNTVTDTSVATPVTTPVIPPSVNPSTTDTVTSSTANTNTTNSSTATNPTSSTATTNTTTEPSTTTSSSSTATSSTTVNATTTPSTTTDASTTTAATPTDNKPVDPNSPESYYYYGGTEPEKQITVPAKPQNNDKSANESNAAATTQSGKNLPAEHKIKAEYNEAYKQLVTNSPNAIPAFRAFLVNYPKHELAGNAQYWLGEALYAQKDFEGASTEFIKVLREHKDSPKASGAALKLGYSYYELKQWDFARRTLEDTIRFFPDSSAAKLAQARLQRMKDEGH